MKLYEREWVEKIKQDFHKLKKKQKYDKADRGRFLADLTGLLGWFNLDPGKELKTLVEEMLLFAEKKQWEHAGQKIAFEHMKKNHKIK